MRHIVALLEFVGGVGVGRLYGYMKYHYPEFQEEMKLRVARKRAERASFEAREEEYRREIDDSLTERSYSQFPRPTMQEIGEKAE